MSFLESALAFLMEKLVLRFLDWVRGKQQEDKSRAELHDQENQSVQKLKDAKTGEEIDAGADDALSGL